MGGLRRKKKGANSERSGETHRSEKKKIDKIPATRKKGEGRTDKNLQKKKEEQREVPYRSRSEHGTEKRDCQDLKKRAGPVDSVNEPRTDETGTGRGATGVM